MYAVIRSGGKQYRVAPGETIEVERWKAKWAARSRLTTSSPSAPTTRKFWAAQRRKAKVTGKIVKHTRGPKLKVLKYKTGGQYKIQTGHRQRTMTAVEVGDIQAFLEGSHGT